MNWTLGNNWYLLLLLLLPLLGIIMVAYLKWKNQRKSIFAEARFQEELFEKKIRFFQSDADPLFIGDPIFSAFNCGFTEWF